MNDFRNQSPWGSPPGGGGGNGGFRRGPTPPDIDEVIKKIQSLLNRFLGCLLYTSPSPRDPKTSRMPSSA